MKTNHKNAYVFGFQELDKTKIALAGGKGANLGEISRINGILVPDGFCVSTEAFRKIIEETGLLKELLEQLALLKIEERTKIAELSAEIRQIIEQTPIPDEISAEIKAYLTKSGDGLAYAVRSSATAEDLPMASFAGQQDTYLNIIGHRAMLQHISKCWASLFTERAVIYRIQHGFDHRKVHLAVIAQHMVFPEAAGILFTADPVSGNRKVLSIDASFGLGEAMVSGIVNADVYKVKNGELIEKQILTKKVAIYALPEGGTQEQRLGPLQQIAQVLSDEQILALASIGRKIEAHFGSPQDIEWCLVDDKFYIVQSRPITTLFPIPDANDTENHVYISVGHQQMMTDPIKPLGLSFYLMVTSAPMRKAGGRLFVDMSKLMIAPQTRKNVLEAMEQSDPLIKDALMNVLDRGDFLQIMPDDAPPQSEDEAPKVALTTGARKKVDNDPCIITDLIKRNEESLENLKHEIRTKAGAELFDFIRDDIGNIKQFLADIRSINVILGAMDAIVWINEQVCEWLGEKKVADIIAQSVPHNITSEMGLALLDVADVIRPYPALIDYLQQAKDDDFMAKLPAFEGGEAAREAIEAFLDTYGMRCAGEIDITRTRWSEKPATLVTMILNNIRSFESGASERKFEQGKKEALEKEQDILQRLKQLPDGEQKAEEVKQMISLIRNFMGYREYPKYYIVSRYFVYKQAMMQEAEKLVEAGVLTEKEDCYYLSFDEFQEVVRTNKLDYGLITQRKEDYCLYEKLTPPRVITSDGEIVTGKYKREHLPADALVGLPVSAGVIEGRARVILNMAEADIEDGDILVTAFTDPSWTPLFVAIKGLVTEVGGLMTHGAVIAREYGLPAVVGVENATKLIRDKQRIRVHGTEGFVEVL
ncbi:phosphoenolpyruvate synthase [Emticicia soli]|uniref:Phosphoenolpyruvate synthase n=1 Tax=Emticicia soli TaxID=2027878 RepID=A0ABW5JAG6_9BACT